MLQQRLALICVLLLIVVGMIGCIVHHEPYPSNGEVLIDFVDGVAPNIVSAVGVDIGERDRIALVDLDPSNLPGEYPSALVYDMLVMAMTKAGYTVVERDTKAFYASVFEGSADRLPLVLGTPCASSHEVAAAAGDEEGGDDDAVIPGVSGEPWTAARRDGESDRVEVNLDADDDDYMPYPEVYQFGIPGCLSQDGEQIVVEQVSATHILAYRVLYFGVALHESTEQGFVDRMMRIDLLLRVVDPSYGVVLWADRVSFDRTQKVSDELAPLLARERFEYFAPQLEGPCSCPCSCVDDSGFGLPLPGQR